MLVNWLSCWRPHSSVVRWIKMEKYWERKANWPSCWRPRSSRPRLEPAFAHAPPSPPPSPGQSCWWAILLWDWWKYSQPQFVFSSSPEVTVQFSEGIFCKIDEKNMLRCFYSFYANMLRCFYSFYANVLRCFYSSSPEVRPVIYLLLRTEPETNINSKEL